MYIYFPNLNPQPKPAKQDDTPMGCHKGAEPNKHKKLNK